MDSRGEALMNHLPKGRPLAINATARSASPTEPAFISPPKSDLVFVISPSTDIRRRVVHPNVQTRDAQPAGRGAICHERYCIREFFLCTEAELDRQTFWTLSDHRTCLGTLSFARARF